jgi:hypothetical protein
MGNERHPAAGGVFYADVVSSPDDPLYIVPAVIPDDTPVKPSTTPASGSAVTTPVSTVTANVVRVDGALEPSGDRSTRAVRFERLNVRRRTRIVRHIDPWSVFRVALVAHFVLYLVLLLAGVLLWNVANATGTVDNIERFMESFGWETFEFNGGELFHQAWILGLFAVVGLTGLAVLAATTFNLITDLVGGVRITVVENRAQPRPEPSAPQKKSTKKKPSANPPA